MFFDASSNVKQGETEGTGIKILNRKQMLQRQPIPLAQVKTGKFFLFLKLIIQKIY